MSVAAVADPAASGGLACLTTVPSPAPLVDLVDETFVVAPPGVLAERLGRPALWREWWPELELTVFQDRGSAGVRWSVTGALVGTAELWLEPYADGTIVHYYLRATPTRRGSRTEPVGPRPAAAARLRRRVAEAYAHRVKRRLNALKDELERDRPPGMPAARDPAVKEPTTATDH